MKSILSENKQNIIIHLFTLASLIDKDVVLHAIVQDFNHATGL